MTDERRGEPTAHDIEREMRRLKAALTSSMPTGVPQNYLSTHQGMTLSGTSVAVPVIRFQLAPSGLLLPATAITTPPSFLDQAGVFLTGSEILGIPHQEFVRLLPPESIEANLATVGLESVALMVAFFMRRLHAVGVDPKDVDRELAAHLAPRIAERVASLLHGDPQRRFLAPQILMVMLKIACAVSTDEPPAALPSPIVPAMFALAEYTGTTEPPTDTSSDRTGEPGKLGRFVISTQVFHASPDEVNLMGRFYQRWLLSPTSDPSDRSVCDLPALFEQATGVPLGDWITVGLGLHGAMQNLDKPPIMIPAAFAQELGWSLERLEAVLHHVCTDAADLRNLVKEETDRFGLDWAFGSFERYPLLRFANGAVLVLDPHLLLRRFLGWLPLFDLQAGLEVQARKREASRAVTYMGKLSERYALDVLASAVGAQGAQRIYDDGALKGAFAGRKTSPRIADAAVDYGGAWLVIEVTTSRLTRASTAGVSDQDVMADIDKLVGEAEQIDSTIKCLRTDEERLTGFPAPQGPLFYPLLVVTEGFPVSPITLPLLRRKVLEKGLLADADIAQLEVVDLVELEALEALGESGGPSILEVLSKKRHASLSNSSVRDFILREMNLQPPRPQRLDALWKSLLPVVARTLGVDEQLGEDGDDVQGP